MHIKRYSTTLSITDAESKWRTECFYIFKCSFDQSVMNDCSLELLPVHHEPTNQSVTWKQLSLSIFFRFSAFTGVVRTSFLALAVLLFITFLLFIVLQLSTCADTVLLSGLFVTRPFSAYYLVPFSRDTAAFRWTVSETATPAGRRAHSWWRCNILNNWRLIHRCTRWYRRSLGWISRSWRHLALQLVHHGWVTTATILAHGTRLCTWVHAVSLTGSHVWACVIGVVVCPVVSIVSQIDCIVAWRWLLRRGNWRWWLIVDGLRRSACILGIRVVIKRRMIWFVMHNTVMKFLYMVRLFGGLMMKLFCFDFLLLRDRCDNIRNLKIYKKGAIFVLLWLVIFIFVCQYFLRTEVKKWHFCK